MTAKEIHYYLLSLGFRGLGIWMLYILSDRVADFLGYVYNSLSSKSPIYTWPDIFQMGFVHLTHLIVAAYFILGAPPFLKWATRDKPPAALP